MSGTTKSATSQTTFQATYSIRASADRVWTALTHPSHLCIWFAEHAEVQMRVGGAFKFWGRHTPTFGVPDKPDQTILEIEPARKLVFTWTWAGAPTRCEIALAPTGADSCRLTVHHDVLGKLGPYDAKECEWFAKDFWDLSAGNLDHYLRKGTPAVLPDHSRRESDVAISIEIDAPPAKVWDAITVPEKIARWLGANPDFPASVQVDLRRGGTYTFGWQKNNAPIGPSRILELEPGRRLVYEWLYPGDHTSSTEWTISPLSGNRTMLTVRQIGVKTDRERCGYANGWASFMVAIADTIEA